MNHKASDTCCLALYGECLLPFCPDTCLRGSSRVCVHFNIIVKSQTLVFKWKLTRIPPYLKLTTANLRWRWGGGSLPTPGLSSPRSASKGGCQIKHRTSVTFKFQVNNEFFKKTKYILKFVWLMLRLKNYCLTEIRVHHTSVFICTYEIWQPNP